MYENNFYHLSDNIKSHLLTLNEYIDYRKQMRQYKDQNNISVSKNQIENSIGNTNRWRQLQNIIQRDKMIQPKEFNYNGTNGDYDKKSYAIADPRQKMQIQRYDYKHPQYRTDPNSLNPAKAEYIPQANAIAYNTNKPTKNIEPLKNHEMHHYQQELLARQLKDRQGARAMWEKYRKNNKSRYNYETNPLEYGANVAAYYKNHNIDPYGDKKAVLQSIQTKRFSGNKISIPQVDGQKAINSINTLTNNSPKYYEPSIFPKINKLSDYYKKWE